MRRFLASADVIGAGATGPRRRVVSLRLGVGRPLGAVLAAGRPCSAADGDAAARTVLVVRVVAVVLLAAQQLHICQVTSRPLAARHAPAGTTLTLWDDGSRRLRVLIAPDCFGDSLTAVEAAKAIADGWRQARPADDSSRWRRSPTAGPASSMCWRAGSASVAHGRVVGPAGRGRSTAEWVFDAASATAYIECAQACGLALLGGPPTVQTAVDAHSGGVGQLVDAALRAGAPGSWSGWAAAAAPTVAAAWSRLSAACAGARRGWPAST